MGACHDSRCLAKSFGRDRNASNDRGAGCRLRADHADRMQLRRPGHEQPGRQDRRLGYGLVNAGRRGRRYREREAAQWPDRIHAPRRGRRVRHLGGPARRHWTAPRNRVRRRTGTDYPAWSPDGSALLFERRKLRPGRQPAATRRSTPSTQTARVSARSHIAAVSAGRTVRPPGRPAETGSPSAAPPARAPRPDPRWSRSTLRTPTVATSGSSRGHRTVMRITFQPGHPMAGRSSSSATPPEAAHRGPTTLIAANVVTGTERIVYRLPSWAPGAGLAAFAPDGKQILFGFWCIYGDSCPASSRSPRT